MVGILLARLPHRSPAVLRPKTIRTEMPLFGVDHLSYSRTLKLVKFLPDRFQAVSFEMPLDDGRKVRFSGGQLLLRQRA